MNPPAMKVLSQSPMLRVNGIDAYVELHGSYDGPRVLLISGTGADLRTDPTRHLHPLVKAGFRVAMYDQRGLGRTSKPDVAYSMGDYADDAAGVLDAIGWADADVVGISFGGMVAQQFVLRHGHRVRRLVLACTSSGGEGGASYDLLALQDWPEARRLVEAARVLDSRNDLSTSPPTYAPGLASYFERIAATRRDIAMAPDADPLAAMGARRQLEARAAHDCWESLATVTAPTLVIGGSFDLQAPVGNVRRLAERIPGAQLVLCDGGHLFLIQDRTAWPTISTFLREGTVVDQ
jgi:3-oxoadipate enol-lactonase